MLRSMLRLAALTGLLVATSAASAPAPHYLLSIHFEDGDRLIGNPRLEVAAGEPATVTVGDAASGSFTMRMTATPAGAGKLAIASTIDVVNAAGVQRRASPVMTVEINRTATIAFGDSSPVSAPVRVSFTYQPR